MKAKDVIKRMERVLSYLKKLEYAGLVDDMHPFFDIETGSNDNSLEIKLSLDITCNSSKQEEDLTPDNEVIDDMYDAVSRANE